MGMRMKTLVLLTIIGLSAPLLANDAAIHLDVYKSPSCGCCTLWWLCPWTAAGGTTTSCLEL